MIIEINKNSRKNIFRSFFDCFSCWFLITTSFYFNYKFIDGNNFLDFMIFIIAVMAFIGYSKEFSRSYKRYNNVSDDKIKEIESILKINESK
jgi:hypothetical protein